MPDKPTDSDLVERARGGDSDAFAELVGRYRNIVVGFSYNIVGDSHAAEDLAQETFIKAYGSLASLEDPAKFGSWLRVIARHTCMDHLRAQKGDVSLETLRSSGLDPAEAGAKPVDREIIVEEEEHEILEALRELREDYREIIILKHIEELSYREIADITELSVSGVGEKLSRVRQMLKKILEKKGKGSKNEPGPGGQEAR